ncbi:MAG TPA: metallophosphoesterase, partial [Arachidicoccus sp.]|nr:metallophosphoesterase [Arachidicoccus sp.]
MIKVGCIFSLCCLLVGALNAQRPAPDFKFAQISDTHVGSATGAADLRRTVKDINADSSLKFVIHSGDVTEFGADSELRLARQILDSLNKPLYIVPGNHDANWSESGANSFRTIIGKETFSFAYDGYLFLGT